MNVTDVVAVYLEAIEAARTEQMTWQVIADAGSNAGLWPDMDSTELATRVARVRKAVDAGKKALPDQRQLPFLVSD